MGWVWSRNVTIYPEYIRSQWRHWIDEDGDCQDTQQDVLIAESEVPVTFETAEQCRVESGQWTDAYSDQVFTDPTDLDVDHVVPLRNAQRSGGWEWTKQRRKEYANDLDHDEHLIAVDRSLNRSKSDQGPDRWLPPDTDYHCQYVADWVAIKQRWGLEVSPAELEAVDVVSQSCP